MIKTLILILIPFLSLSQEDSITHSWYVRTMPIGIYSGASLQKDRISQNIEVGQSIGPVDIGVAFGRRSLRPDSSCFIGARITMDACQYGIFSNEFALGGGYVFNSTMPVMLEMSTTIFAQIGENWGLGVITGYIDFGGNYVENNKTFYGLFFRYGLLRNDGGILMNKSRTHHPHHSHH